MESSDPNYIDFFYQYEKMINQKYRFHFYTLNDNNFIFDSSNIIIHKLTPDITGPFQKIFNQVSMKDKYDYLQKLDPVIQKKMINVLYRIDNRKPLIEAGQVNQSSYIQTINFSQTIQCNLQCTYCYVNRNNQKIQGQLNLDKTIKFIKKEIKRNQLKKLVLGFGYLGEPFLSIESLIKIHNFAKLCKMENQCQIDLYFTTNGTILNDDVISYLNEYSFKIPDKSEIGINILNISLDGPEIIHDVNRQFKNKQPTYSIIIKNIQKLEAFFQNRNFQVMICANLTKTYPRPFNLAKYFINQKDFKLHSFTIKPVRNGTDCDIQEDNLPLLKEEYDQYFNFIYQLFIDQNIKILSLISNDFTLKFFKRIMEQLKVHERCKWGNGQITIGPDEALYYCDAVVGNQCYQIGTLDEGLNSQKLDQDYFNIDDIEHCQLCKFKYICGGTCYAAAARLDHIKIIDPVECQINKIIIENSIVLFLRLINSGIDYSALYNKSLKLVHDI